MKIKWNEIEVIGHRSLEFSTKTLLGQKNSWVTEKAKNALNEFGGVVRRGEWAWLAHGCTLHIISLRNGHSVCKQDFAELKGLNNGCVIKCIAEVWSDNFGESVLLAVGLVNNSSADESYITLYSIEQRIVLSCMQLQGSISCVTYMRPAVCRRSLLQYFDGCLAVGSDEGIVVLLDLYVHKLLTHDQSDNTPKSCQIINYNLSLTEIHRDFQNCQQRGEHFGLQMEVIELPCSIRCMLPIDLILGLAIGLEDGRLAFYDLAEMQIFYVAMPQTQLQMSPLVKMNFLEPPDDPRPCLYVWAVHEDDSYLTAVMHSLTYERRIFEMDTLCFLETFQNSSVRLQLPLESNSRRGVAIGCQSIMKITANYEEDSHCLCALSWYAHSEEKNKLLIFDLNQWYKEEMPSSVHWQNTNNYLAGFFTNGRDLILNIEINPCTIAHFNSMQRFEEHFYPNSLSFDCLLLFPEGSRCHYWEGSQNRVIGMLRASNASIFLDPDIYLNEILRNRLVPQFSDLNINATFANSVKYEILLSAALENNCFSLLRDCAKCWADGSFTGNITAPTNLSLDTLTDWVWKRAAQIKSSCNNLCKGLFGIGGYPLDQREQKELGLITRQLKMLSDLLGEILGYSNRALSHKTMSILESRHRSLHMSADYQSILLWLVNIGLLPEASPHSCNKISDLVPYPYTQLKTIYAKKRKFFGKLSDDFVSKKTGSCRLLYIDAFIEHECKGTVLRKYWLEHNGDGLYPPTSIEAMLRVMLVPDVALNNKCAILLYFLLDLNMTIDELAYKKVVENFIKFPSVFKLSASLIKTVQAFWNLDHGHFLPAVDEFISPFNNSQTYQEWLFELLIETLLTQNGANLALRILEARSLFVPPVLKLKTLLANELISEAFHFARSKQADALLNFFFSCCLSAGRFDVIRDLALNEREGELLQCLLKRCKTQSADNLNFVYLLQKSKYIEAVSFMDELSKTHCLRQCTDNENSVRFGTGIDTPNIVLSAFNMTMAPVTQRLADVYFRIKNKIKQKESLNASPVPLSCQLIKQNANNLIGGIYHSSALSAHFATYYWENMENSKQNGNSLLSTKNAPFLRKPQNESNGLVLGEANPLSYPQTYISKEKRTLTERDRDDCSTSTQGDTKHVENPKKRSRLEDQLSTNDERRSTKPNRQSFKSLELSSTQQAKNEDATAFDFQIQSPVKLSNQSFADERGDCANKPLSIVVGTEIHGILKINTSEHEPSHQLHRNTMTKEDKNLRFISIYAKKNETFSGTFNAPTTETNSLFSGPQPRKPLVRDSIERLEKSLTPEFSNLIEEPISELLFKSFKEAADKPIPQVTSETLLPSRTSEFFPKISSSKVCETNLKFNLEEKTSYNEYTDFSTVIGSLTYNEETSRTSVAYTIPGSTPQQPFSDTTISMSSYDVAVLDTTSSQVFSSSLIQNNNSHDEHLTEIDYNRNNNNVNVLNAVCAESEEDRKSAKVDSLDTVYGSKSANSSSVKLKLPNTIAENIEYVSNDDDTDDVSNSSVYCSESCTYTNDSEEYNCIKVVNAYDSMNVKKESINLQMPTKDKLVEEFNKVSKDLKYDREDSFSKNCLVVYDSSEITKNSLEGSLSAIEHDVRKKNNDSHNTYFADVNLEDLSQNTEHNEFPVESTKKVIEAKFGDDCNVIQFMGMETQGHIELDLKKTKNNHQDACRIKKESIDETENMLNEKHLIISSIQTEAKIPNEIHLNATIYDEDQVELCELIESGIVHIDGHVYCPKRKYRSVELNQIVDKADYVDTISPKLKECRKYELEVENEYSSSYKNKEGIYGQNEEQQNETPEGACEGRERHKNNMGKCRPHNIITQIDSEIDGLTKRRQIFRGTSVPPLQLDKIEGGLISTLKRSMRSKSVPPQTLAENEDDIRMLDEKISSSMKKQHTRRVSNRRSITPSNADCDDESVSLNSATSVRQHATKLRSIRKDTVTLDSPSSRTRSRLRLNSMDSEIDTSTVSNTHMQTKRTRRTSVTSNVSEEPCAPVKLRRNSNMSQIESLTTSERASQPKSLSVAVVDSNQPPNEKSENEIWPSRGVTTLDASSYSLSRRLTRTQLTVMKKSAEIAGVTRDNISTDVKGLSNRRLSRSTAPTYRDSDENESMSSRSSIFSNPAMNRRITRSSVKNMDESDDDSVSVLSSGSEKLGNPLLKAKISPNIALAAIPEDESEDKDVTRTRRKNRKY